MKFPASAEELKAAGYKSTGTGNCRSCGKAVIWVKTPTGAQMPMVEVTAAETLFTAQARLFQSHFADCPNAASHSRKRRA